MFTMVTPLVYIDIFNKKPDRLPLIRWLNIKLYQKAKREEAGWGCCRCCRELAPPGCEEEVVDGYISDGAFLYDEPQQRCFELTEIRQDYI